MHKALHCSTSIETADCIQAAPRPKVLKRCSAKLTSAWATVSELESVKGVPQNKNVSFEI